MPGIRIAIVYHSSYSHTGRRTEAVKCGVERVEGAKALLPRVDEAPARWGDLTFAEAVIYLPTCTGGPPAQFKAFEDASSHAVMTSGLWLER